MLDFSGNNFSGPIPPNLNQLKGLQRQGQTLTGGTLYKDNVEIVGKGQVPSQVIDFVYVLSATTSLDLSGNEIDGDIPQQLGDLSEPVS